jgi:hypothetical protein
MEFKAPRSGSQAHGLSDLRFAETADNADTGPQWIALDDLNGVDRNKVGDVVEVRAVDIPRVEGLGVVLMELEQIASSAFGQYFPSQLLISY